MVHLLTTSTAFVGKSRIVCVSDIDRECEQGWSHGVIVLEDLPYFNQRVGTTFMFQYTFEHLDSCLTLLYDYELPSNDVSYIA